MRGRGQPPPFHHEGRGRGRGRGQQPQCGPSGSNPERSGVEYFQNECQTSQVTSLGYGLYMSYKSPGNKLRKESQEQFNEMFLKDHPNLNPYETILALVTRDNEHLNGGPTSFAARVLEAFNAWIMVNSAKYTGCITTQLQQNAFDAFVRVKTSSLFVRVMNICKIKCLPGMDETVKSLLKCGNAKRASEIVIHTGTHDMYTLEQVAVPLVLTDPSGSSLDDFLKGSTRHQSEFVTWLDELNLQKVSDICKGYPELKAKNTSRLQGKPLAKFIESLVAKYDLNGSSVAPKHFKQKAINDLRYWVSEKTSPKMRIENWRELIESKVRSDDDLKKKLLELLVDGRTTGDYDVPEAFYWAEKLDINTSDRPWSVQQYVAESQMSGLSISEENWDDDDEVWERQSPLKQATNGAASNDWQAADMDWNTKASQDSNNTTTEGSGYYPLKVGKEKIYFINSCAQFDEFLKSIKTESLTAVDCEYRLSSLDTNTKESVALVQIATPDKVFILDMIVLIDLLSEKQLKDLVQQYFLGELCLILGYGLRNDYRVLANTHPAFQRLVDNERQIKNVLDLEMLSNCLTSGYKKVVDLPYSSSDRGLAGLVEQTFGLPLDKRDQRSNWDKRPLTETQFVYAALDAFVLCELYHKLFELCVTMGGEQGEETFTKLESELKRNQNKLPKSSSNSAKKNKRRGTQEEQDADVEPRMPIIRQLNSSPVEPTDLKVVCDNMIQGLCKKLRLYGVDAVATESFEHFEICGKIAKEQSRMILTRSHGNFKKLRSVVPHGHCLFVRTEKTDDQIDEVLHYFNVQVEGKHVFTRCQACNGSNYIELPQKVAQQIAQSQGVTLPKETGRARDEQQEDYSRFNESASDEEDSDGEIYVAVKKNPAQFFENVNLAK